MLLYHCLFVFLCYYDFVSYLQLITCLQEYLSIITLEAIDHSMTIGDNVWK